MENEQANAEIQLLGALLLASDIDTAELMLGREHFADRRRALVYEAIVLAKARHGGASDPVVVGERLNLAGVLQEAGGHEHLIDLLESVVTSAGVLHHARVLIEARGKATDGVEQ